MSRFIYDDEDVKGLKIIQPMDKEQKDHHGYSNPDLAKGLSDLATQRYGIDNVSKVFDQLAVTLLRQTVIVTPKNNFNLREIEFYLYDEVLHPDSYAHKNKRQSEFGEWYFHRFTDIEPFLKSNRNGVDITFGNKEKGIYGGVLIRKIENVKTKELVVGINKVARKLIDNIGRENVNNIALGNGQLAFDKEQLLHLKVGNPNFSKSIYKTQRYGLTFKNEETANQYYKAQYCYYNHDLNTNTITQVKSGI